MPAPYSVIDRDGGIHGPFDTLGAAQRCTADLPVYELLNAAGDLVDWLSPRPAPAADEETRGAGCALNTARGSDLPPRTPRRTIPTVAA
jgi:hypothetical protein